MANYLTEKRSLISTMLPGTSTQPSRLPMATPIRRPCPVRETATRASWTYKGVEKVIRSLVHLRDTFRAEKRFARELKYFRPIGIECATRRSRNKVCRSVQEFEAACKTLATQRMKRSGMRWGEQGGQAILSFRAVQSNRFERASELLYYGRPSLQEVGFGGLCQILEQCSKCR